MWLFTRYGFYSVVCARRGHGETGQPLDAARLMVRARVPEHLEALRARFPELLAECPLVTSAATDYACRIFVDKDVWARVAEQLAAEIDFGNFKSAVASHQGRAGSRYTHALGEVWRVMCDLQVGGWRR